MTHPAPYGGTEPILLSVGDISCTATQVITPAGTYPLAGTQWTFADMSHTTHEIPAWAIVLAILFFLVCLLGLLFLLVKEERTTGYAHVTVQGEAFLHTAQVPISSPAMVADLHARVNYARMLVNYADRQG